SALNSVHHSCECFDETQETLRICSLQAMILQATDAAINFSPRPACPLFTPRNSPSKDGLQITTRIWLSLLGLACSDAGPVRRRRIRGCRLLRSRLVGRLLLICPALGRHVGRSHESFAPDDSRSDEEEYFVRAPL